MANKYKGEVEFMDSTGQSFVLRLGTNEYISIQSQLDKLNGREFQRFLFHQALIHGAESQKDMTIEEAGELLDDLGYEEANDLINRTKFGSNVEKSAKKQKGERDAASAAAARSLGAKVSALRKDMKDPAALDALDRVSALVTQMQPASEGSANPPEETASRN